MAVKKYDDMQIEVLRSTPHPAEIVGKGLQTCMKHDPKAVNMTSKQAKYLLSAGHTSPLEHAVMTIFVTGVSRAFLAQVTRHRTFSFTVSSQHYQSYQDYDMIVSRKTYDLYYDLTDATDKSTAVDNMQVAFTSALRAYNYARVLGLPKEEARQFLPNAMACNILITADARNMVNFFTQRCCRRNVEEMHIFAHKWLQIARYWFPVVFNNVGSPCSTQGKCSQGKMQADICREGRGICEKS